MKRESTNMRLKSLKGYEPRRKSKWRNVQPVVQNSANARVTGGRGFGQEPESPANVTLTISGAIIG